MIVLPQITERAPHASSPALEHIARLDSDLALRFAKKLAVEPVLTRQLVSFQANKQRAQYRWFKYKEAFSASLVEHLLFRYRVTQCAILDPFAGSGTALFAASEMGLDADGVELLPVAQAIVKARLCAQRELDDADIERLEQWLTQLTWEHWPERQALPELRITAGAYPPVTTDAIERYLASSSLESARVRTILQFALLCVLESVSYTRKDGQYLRWDSRSGRRAGSRPFDKGAILSVASAIERKLHEILTDVRDVRNTDALASLGARSGGIRLLAGSSLDLMQRLSAGSYGAVITSPPYCNRYDYTRTYALELALLGLSERGVVELRQNMLSATVENRAKDLLGINPNWRAAIRVADQLELLQSVLGYLEAQKAEGKLNNNAIPRMVRGYFYEMVCIIAECARLLKPGGLLFMVNDNVRYAGVSISVDLILSAMAGEMGFRTERIMALPNGKGNSSQQMGRHGREALRKCVYVWRRE